MSELYCTECKELCEPKLQEKGWVYLSDCCEAKFTRDTPLEKAMNECKYKREN